MFIFIFDDKEIEQTFPLESVQFHLISHWITTLNNKGK